MKIIDVGYEVWMWVHQDLEWVEYLKNCFHSKQTTSLISLLLAIIGWIDKTMNLVTWNTQKENNDDDNN